MFVYLLVLKGVEDYSTKLRRTELATNNSLDQCTYFRIVAIFPAL